MDRWLRLLADGAHGSAERAAHLSTISPLFVIPAKAGIHACTTTQAGGARPIPRKRNVGSQRRALSFAPQESTPRHRFPESAHCKGSSAAAARSSATTPGARSPSAPRHIRLFHGQLLAETHRQDRRDGRVTPVLALEALGKKGGSRRIGLARLDDP